MDTLHEHLSRLSIEVNSVLANMVFGKLSGKYNTIENQPNAQQLTKDFVQEMAIALNDFMVLVRADNEKKLASTIRESAKMYGFKDFEFDPKVYEKKSANKMDMGDTKGLE